MRRRLLNVLTALSLLLCSAVTLLCVRSHFATDSMWLEGRPWKARVVCTQGDAILGTRAVDSGPLYWDVSVALGTNDRPHDPDYISEGPGWYGPPKADEPPGRGWKALPYDAFVTVPLWVVAVVFAFLPARWLIARSFGRSPARTERVPTPKRRRFARAAVTTSTVVLVLGILGWIDSATWHRHGLQLGWDRTVSLTSQYGECELFLVADWGRDESPESLASTTPWERRHRPMLHWYREPWLEPQYRGHHTPQRLQLFTGFTLLLATEDGPRFVELFDEDADGKSGHLESDSDPDRTGLFGDDAAGASAQHSPITGFALDIPYWFVVVFAAILPTLTAIQALRRNYRHREGHCRRCGYDLRASQDRCPECGAAAMTPA